MVELVGAGSRPAGWCRPAPCCSDRSRGYALEQTKSEASLKAARAQITQLQGPGASAASNLALEQRGLELARKRSRRRAEALRRRQCPDDRRRDGGEGGARRREGRTGVSRTPWPSCRRTARCSRPSSSSRRPGSRDAARPGKTEIIAPFTMRLREVDVRLAPGGGLGSRCCSSGTGSTWSRFRRGFRSGAWGRCPRGPRRPARSRRPDWRRDREPTRSRSRSRDRARRGPGAGSGSRGSTGRRLVCVAGLPFRLPPDSIKAVVRLESARRRRRPGPATCDASAGSTPNTQRSSRRSGRRRPAAQGAKHGPPLSRGLYVEVELRGPPGPAASRSRRPPTTTASSTWPARTTASSCGEVTRPEQEPSCASPVTSMRAIGGPHRAGARRRRDAAAPPARRPDRDRPRGPGPPRARRRRRDPLLRAASHRGQPADVGVRAAGHARRCPACGARPIQSSSRPRSAISAFVSRRRRGDRRRASSSRHRGRRQPASTASRPMTLPVARGLGLDHRRDRRRRRFRRGAQRHQVGDRRGPRLAGRHRPAHAAAMSRRAAVASIAVPGRCRPSIWSCYCGSCASTCCASPRSRRWRWPGSPPTSCASACIATALARHALSVSDVAKALEAQSVDRPIGTIARAGGDLLVRYCDKRTDPSALAQIRGQGGGDRPRSGSPRPRRSRATRSRSRKSRCTSTASGRACSGSPRRPGRTASTRSPRCSTSSTTRTSASRPASR